MGYDRLEDPALLAAINELYVKLWESLHNFFMPSMKLASKERHGAKVKRQHDQPRTPCERLLESEHICENTKNELRLQREALNPFDLHEQLEQSLRAILHRALRSSRPTDSLHFAPDAAIINTTTVS